MEQGATLLIITFVIIGLILCVGVIIILKKRRLKKLKNEIIKIEIEKNLIASTPVLSELSKAEAIIKNEKMEEKVQKWQEQFDYIKDVELNQLTDMIVELDLEVDQKNYYSFQEKLAQAELEIYKIKSQANRLLDEVREITLSDEKYRNMVTKLKAKYRELSQEFQKNKESYDEVSEMIELQLETIEKRFSDFENAMENNEYSEVVHIVHALEAMLEHMEVVIDEVPDLILLAKHLIPKRIEQVEENYQDMIKKNYPLGYLKVEYNIEQTIQNTNSILDRIKVLNLEDCMFELKTMLDYLDSLFYDFEKEILSKKVFEEIKKDLFVKLENINHIVDGINLQLDDIKKMYDLTTKDLTGLEKVKKSLIKINKDYDAIINEVDLLNQPFSKAHYKLEELTKKLKELEEKLDLSLKSLGSLYEDELRAKEQLKEFRELLNNCKMLPRFAKLPVILEHYYIELEEANEAVDEIIKELNRKPIAIKTLNTRVDTARDLVLKLYKTTTDLIHDANLAEQAIIYSNRYRRSYVQIDQVLDKAERTFYKGEYRNALGLVIDGMKKIEPNFEHKLIELSEK